VEIIEMNAAVNKQSAGELLAQLLAGKMPDKHGRFGPYGGSYIPETLVPAFERLTEAVYQILPTADFQRELAAELKDWVGRPTALSPMRGLSRRWGAEVWFKREDLAHTGAHKINNALGQALLPPVLAWACPASCTWVKWTWSVRRRTLVACA
jgi:tryptophan synthase beta chain